MIPVLRHAGLSGCRFSTVHLPVEIQDAVLRNVMAPRVASSSMAPTLMPGDVLELESADDLRIGDVLVFRHGNDYVCHRLVGRRDEFLLMKGDASTGEPEVVEPGHVLGKVSAIVRAGDSVQPTRLPQRLPLRGRLRERLRAALPRDAFGRGCSVAARFLRCPVLAAGFRRMTRRWIAIEILEAAPLKCTQGFVSRATLRLNQHEQLVRTLAAHTDWQSLSLLLHLGPITLGTCRISPWVLSLRPSMHCLHLEEALDPLAEILRDNTGAGPKTIETLRT